MTQEPPTPRTPGGRSLKALRRLAQVKGNEVIFSENFLAHEMMGTTADTYHETSSRDSKVTDEEIEDIRAGLNAAEHEPFRIKLIECEFMSDEESVMDNEPEEENKIEEPLFIAPTLTEEQSVKKGPCQNTLV